MLTRILRVSTLLFSALVIAVLLAEMVLRLVGFEETIFYRPDPELGFALRPQAAGWWRKEGEAWIEISKHGLRDHEHPLSKPRGVYRIAVLGDSYAEALQVPLEQTFWSVLENKLGSCPALSGRQVEVINFGVSAYGTAQELLMYRHRARLYEPDLVLLAFATGNDVRNNSRQLEADPLKPYFHYKDGELREDLSFRESPWFGIATVVAPIMEHSRILQLMYVIRIKLKQAIRDSQMRSHVSNPMMQEVGLDSEIYAPPVDPVWDEAWRVTEDLMVILAEEVSRVGGDFVLATLSNGIQVHPDRSRRREFENKLGIRDMFYPEKRISDVGRRGNFRVLPLAPMLQMIAERDKVFLHGFTNTLPGAGHWNRDGHQRAGDLLADALCADLISRRKR